MSGARAHPGAADTSRFSGVPSYGAEALVRVAAVLLVLGVAAACRDRSPESWLGSAQPIAEGVELYRVSDGSLVEHAGPISVFLLRLDPELVSIASALSNDRVTDAETVIDIAARRHAIAAVNGGFFNRSNGEPTGLLKVSGELVSDSAASRGAVVIGHGPADLLFDRLSAKVTAVFSDDGREWRVRVDGVDTTRERGKLMLYTPAYHPDTDTAPTGTEWIVSDDPPQITAVRRKSGRTRIPPAGGVLSFGGVVLPEPLASLEPGVNVRFETAWQSASGIDRAHLDRSVHIINGAGLLRREGALVTDWKAEGLSHTGFVNVRHPRTLIGRDVRGFVWLAAVDGRQPDYSIGMSFSDLQRLADRLELTDALNLDGGGSTTMVVKGQVINRPSDPAGLRPVSDAILVVGRGTSEAGERPRD
jgi:hypothetical protein